jgi:hypothetical protein
MEDIVYEISEESKSDQLEVDEDNHESDQMSFVDPHVPTINFTTAEGIKKKKFDAYLDKHRNSLPTIKKKESNLED